MTSKGLVGRRLERRRQFCLSPGVLELSTNFLPVYNFIFGIPPAWGEVNHSEQKSLVTLRWDVVEDLDSMPWPSTSIFRGRKLGIQKSAEIRLDWNGGQPILATNPPYQWWASLRGTASHELPGRILSHAATVALLEQDLCPIHCAAVEYRGKGILMIAPSNTGKTTTTWDLVMNRRFAYVAEDIAIHHEGTIYGCAFTGTGLPRPFPEPSVGVWETLRRAVFPVWSKASLAKEIGQERIKAATPCEMVIFLERGVDKIEDVTLSEAADLLVRNNRMEFRYQTSPLLIESWYASGVPDLHRASLDETRLLRSLAEIAPRIIKITSSDPRNFGRQIEGIVK